MPTTNPTHRRWPAEWEPQSGVQLTWPHAQTDWAEYLASAEAAFSVLGSVISQYTKLLVVCLDTEHAHHAHEQLCRSGANPDHLHYAFAPCNDTWTRDHGAITVLEAGHPHLLDFRFNGWGGKYPADLDDQINRTLHQQGVFGTTPLTTLDWVLEGGSIDSDGAGTILTTQRCLLTPTRNPELDRAALEHLLCATLGAERVLWLEHGHLQGDDTDGHVDTLARFCDPATIAYVQCNEDYDPHFNDLKAMEAQLGDLRQRNGEPYRLVPLPMPAPFFAGEHRLPATYANFLILEQAVLVPHYQDPADAVADATLQAVFPERDIVGVDSREFIIQGGSLHCLTMQFPAGVL